jgi:hypothetical protein
MWVMESLVQRNQAYLKARPNTPRLYQSGVVYKLPAQMDGEVPEVSLLKQFLSPSGLRDNRVLDVLDKIQAVLGGERFRDIGRIIENGGGDCDNVACWRAAELRQAGIKARPYMTSRIRPDGGTTYHALVLWPPIPGANYVTSEDPSLLLGMGGPARAAERAEEIRKNAERCDLLRGKKPSATSPLSPAADPEIDALEGALGLRRPSRPRPEIDALETLLGLRKKRAA